MFKTARERGDSAKAAEGYVLTLDALGRALEAEPIAYQWRDSSADNLAAYLDTAVLILATSPPIRLDRAMLERIAAVTMQAKNPNVAEQLGWYAYNIGQPKTAIGWFRTTLAWDPSHEAAAYGLAVASLKLKDRAGFNRIYAAWGNRSERIAALARPGVKLRGSAVYAPVPDAMAPFAAGVPGPSATPSPAILPSGIPMTMLPSGAASAAPTPALVPSPAPLAVPPVAYTVPPVPSSPVVPIAPEYGGGPAVPLAVEEPVIAEVPLRTTDYGAAPAPAPRATSCAALAARHSPIATLSADAAARLGWCFMEVDRPFEASKAFARAIEIGAGRTRTDAAYGKSLADLRSGLTKDAAVAAAEAPQPVGRQVELTIAILAQRANAAFADGRYMETIIALDERARLAPEQNDLLVLRGFAYFKMGRLRDAQQIFQAVADTGYPDGMKGLAAVAAATRPN